MIEFALVQITQLAVINFNVYLYRTKMALVKYFEESIINAFLILQLSPVNAWWRNAFFLEFFIRYWISKAFEYLTGFSYESVLRMFICVDRLLFVCQGGRKYFGWARF